MTSQPSSNSMNLNTTLGCKRAKLGPRLGVNIIGSLDCPFSMVNAKLICRRSILVSTWCLDRMGSCMGQYVAQRWVKSELAM